MKFTSPVSLSDKQFIAQSILPGESQAILTLEDGQTIHINKETESLLEKIDEPSPHGLYNAELPSNIKNS